MDRESRRNVRKKYPKCTTQCSKLELRDHLLANKSLKRGTPCSPPPPFPSNTFQVEHKCLRAVSPKFCATKRCTSSLQNFSQFLQMNLSKANLIVTHIKFLQSASNRPEVPGYVFGRTVLAYRFSSCSFRLIFKPPSNLFLIRKRPVYLFFLLGLRSHSFAVRVIEPLILIVKDKSIQL